MSPVNPANTQSGAEQRSHLLWRAARAVGDTDVLQLQEGSRSAVVGNQSAEQGRWVHAEAAASRLPWKRFASNARLTTAIESELGESLACYDLIVGRYLWPLSQLAVPRGTPTLVDLDDWRFRHAPGAAMTWSSVETRSKKAFAHWLAQQQLRRFSAAFAVSAQDAVELQASLPLAFLPNVPVDLPASVSAVPATPLATFVGSLWYPPNREAVAWLLTAVWPKVRAAVPEARLNLLGAAAPAIRAQWACVPGVDAPGFVDDLAAAYAASALIVAPMFSGGGTNIKVLEALGHGRPCLTTPLVSAAFSDTLMAGRHLLVADTAPAFAAQMIAALRQPAALQAMADEGRRAVLERFTAASFERTAEAFMQQLIATRRNA